MENNNTFGVKHIDLFTENVDEITDNNFLIPTGFDDFDKQHGGFTLGDFIVIGGRPSMGKSLLAISLALNISSKFSVLFYSFEQTEQNLGNRFFSAMCGFPLHKLVSNGLQKKKKFFYDGQIAIYRENII